MHLPSVKPLSDIFLVWRQMECNCLTTRVSDELLKIRVLSWSESNSPNSAWSICNSTCLICGLGMAWQACAVYCRLDSGVWYTPKRDANIATFETFFPDGTWCHFDGFRSYYCIQHECVPEISNNGSISQWNNFWVVNRAIGTGLSIQNVWNNNTNPYLNRQSFNIILGVNAVLLAISVWMKCLTH